MRIPRFFKNFYLLSALLFVSWMFFFDGNDVITQMGRQERLEKLAKDKAYYQKEIQKIERDQEALLNDSLAIERFAREKFFLKKPKEDVYVIVEDDKVAEEIDAARAAKHIQLNPPKKKEK